MQVLIILVAVVFLSYAALSLAQRPDQKVSKAISDGCQRNAAQEEADENEIENQGGNVNLLVAHYCELP